MTIINKIETERQLIDVMLELFKGFEQNAKSAVSRPDYRPSVEQLEFVLTVIGTRSHNIQEIAAEFRKAQNETTAAPEEND